MTLRRSRWYLIAALLGLTGFWQGIAGTPVIDVWYGTSQRFGATGIPQRWVNILGNVTDPDGIQSFRYSVNGGPFLTASRGPDGRRLNKTGDFNIDLKYESLNPGSNSVTLRALSIYGSESSVTLNIINASGPVWKKNYTVNWSGSSSLQDSAQVVDGKWMLYGGGLRTNPSELGYDRLVAIGDTTWTEYEVTVPVTVNSVDLSSSSFDQINGGPAVGLLFRWKGHTMEPAFTPPITQPQSGYLPVGAIGWYHWKDALGSEQWELLGNNLTDLGHNPTDNITVGNTYMFKMRVKNISNGATYSFKKWLLGQSEPASWMLSGSQTNTGTNPTAGSFMLVAHHVDATFGKVTVVPLSPVGTPTLLQPADLSTGVSAPVTLRWTSDPSAATYSIQVATDPTFASGIVIANSSVVDTTFVAAGLSGSQQYYWRVSGANPDKTGSWSSVFSFNTTLATPQLVAPSYASSGLSTAISFRWRMVNGATAYWLQVGTDSTFVSGLVYDTSTLTDTTQSVTVPSGGGRYFWRVCARDASGPTAFSSPWVLTTALPAPTLATPADNAVGQSMSPTLRWRALRNATQYRLQVARDSQFTTMVLQDSLLTDTLRVVPGLLSGVKYFWRVRGKNAYEPGSFSGFWRFTVLMPAPLLASPENGAAGQPSNATVTWFGIAGASKYKLELGSDSTFATGIVVRDSSITDTSFTTGALPGGQRFFWHVAARDGGGFGNFSSTWRFSTGLGTPALVNPTDGALEQPLTIQLVWHSVPNATAYVLQMATDPTFATGIIKNDSTITDTMRTIVGLTNGTWYYWRVCARNPQGRGAFSPDFSFRSAGLFPSQVQLVLPVTHQRVNADSALFIWHPSAPGITRYWFELSIDSMFMFRSVDTMVIDTTKLVRQLMMDRTYWWRVRAANLEGWGPFSLIRAVETVTTDVPTAGGILPSAWGLQQNFPNPFNPTTHITYDVPQAGRVRLEVFNILGERVALLVDEQRPPGRYTVEFSSGGGRSTLPSGMYLYRLTAAQTVLTRKMLLLK